jgi:hypothetical protein
MEAISPVMMWAVNNKRGQIQGAMEEVDQYLF